MQSNITTAESPKLKIKRTIKEEREIDIEVNLPYFIKYGNYTFIKVKENENCIIVSDFGFDVSIKISDKVNSYYLPDSVVVSEDEFYQAFESALTKIQNQNL